MIYVVLGFAALALVGAFVLALNLASALKEVNAAKDLWRTQCAITDATVVDRDVYKRERDVARKALDDAALAMHDAQQRITELSAKVVKLTAGKIATAPLDEGAAVVNDLFATPIGGPK